MSKQEIVPVTKKDFRLQNRWVVLTYMGKHLDKDYFMEELRGCFPRHKELRAWIAHEICPETENAHTHVVIDFQKRVQTTDCRKFDFEGIHPNIKPILGSKHFVNAVRYLAKEDPENKELEGFVLEGADKPSDIERIEEIIEQPTLLDAIKCGSIREATCIKTIYECKPVAKKEVALPEFGWYEDFFKLKSNYRKIIWIYETSGNTGKSVLAKKLMAEMGWYCIKTGVNVRDFGSIMLNAISHWKGGDGNLIFDLPRVCEGRKEMYTCLENASDGMVTATKYAGSTVMFDCQKVVVMANFAPEVVKLSLDRWEIYQIVDDRLKRVDTYKLRNEQKVEDSVCLY